MFLKNKIGQFYLMTALIIITLIVSIIAIYNYSSRKEYSRVHDLAEELKVESGKVLDYGAINEVYPWDSFTNNFTDYAGKDIEITYVTGNSSDYSAFYYDQIGVKQNTTFYFVNPTLTVTHNNANYTFNLREGQNFYFVISQHIGDEYYVTTN